MKRRSAPPSSSSPFAIDLQPQVLKKTRRTKGGDGLAGRAHKITTPSNGKGGATDLVASFIEKICKTKRSDDDFTRRSHKSIRDRNDSGKTTESMVLLGDLHEDSNQWTRLSDDDFARRMHKSVRGRNASGKTTESMDLGDLHEDSNQLTTLSNDDFARRRHKSIRGRGDSGKTTELMDLDLNLLHYPMPRIGMPNDRIILVNTFEETFGDPYPKGVWHEFNKSCSSDIDRYVVTLASFKGGQRHFACTGFFIEWNGSGTILTSASLIRSSSDEHKADKDLEIEVLLPNKRCIDGMLQHYSLHYNVALIAVKDCRVLRPASIQPYRFGCSKVAAVGRSVSGELMATTGRLVSWSGTLDCLYCVRSSCKITKAGIGGPLVNMLDGKVIGMNFYDNIIGTPFLLWEDINKILTHFMEEKSKDVEVGCDDCDPSSSYFWKMEGDDSHCPSRWPVPEPCWLRRDDLVEDEFEDDESETELYGYSGGRKVTLL